jgi:hypothetical protein
MAMTTQDGNRARLGSAQDDSDTPRKPWVGLKGAAAAAAKADYALLLREAGFNLTRIAKECGYADSTGARRAVARALRGRQRESHEDLRLLMVGRLEEYHRALWRRCLEGDRFAIATSLAVMDRLATLLGLDAPSRLEISTVDELDDWIAKLDRQIEAKLAEND